jgi:hypothetical protein
MGFVTEPGTYLRDGWNKLDFIVVFTGYSFFNFLHSRFFRFLDMINLFPAGGSTSSQLRTIRLLRPLRSINKVKGIRVLVKSFIYSIPPLANVALFLTFIICVLATFGLHLFAGVFEYRCRKTPDPPTDGGFWEVVEGHELLCKSNSDGEDEQTIYNENVFGHCP